MLVAQRLAGITPEVNLREFVTHKPPPSENKAAQSGFEIQRIHHKKPKTGTSVTPPPAHKKVLCHPKLKKEDSTEF